MTSKLIVYVKLIICYLCDAYRFIRFAHLHPSQTRSKPAVYANLMRLCHSLEKGLALPVPRVGFGSGIAGIALSDLSLYCDNFGPDSLVNDCLGIIEATADFHLGVSHHERWLEYQEQCKKIRQIHFSGREFSMGPVGAISLDRQEVVDCAPRDVHSFFLSRRSVRQYSEVPVTIEEIRKAVGLAQRAPSVCNRQGSRCHAFTEPESMSKILELQDGNSGFGQSASVLFIITGDLSIFYKSGERNQAFIDGGIFAMSLVLVLHAMGLGSCLLNWAMTPRQDSRLRQLVEIPENEVVISMLVAGNLRDKYLVAASPRRPLDEVLSINQNLKL